MTSKDGLRKPAASWNEFIANSSSSPDSLESGLLAALDLGLTGDAEICLAKLQEKFPESKRVKKLEGMVREADGRRNDARGIYARMLESDKADRGALKRLVALEKGERKWGAAVTALKNYIEIYQCDEEAWLELAELYQRDGNPKKSLQAYEECILLEPYNYLYSLKYAEALYGQGDYKMARQYYAQSLVLNAGVDTNLRGYYGLIAASKHLKGGDQDLLKWARGKLEPLARESAPLADLFTELDSK